MKSALIALVLIAASPAFADDCAVTVHSGTRIDLALIDPGDHAYALCTDENPRDVTIAGVTVAQNGKYNVNPFNDGPAQRQARIEACFRDAPQTSARDAWLDRCLKEAR
jgi:hypothetical protein